MKDPKLEHFEQMPLHPIEEIIYFLIYCILIFKSNNFKQIVN